MLQVTVAVFLVLVSGIALWRLWQAFRPWLGADGRRDLIGLLLAIISTSCFTAWRVGYVPALAGPAGFAGTLLLVTRGDPRRFMDADFLARRGFQQPYSAREIRRTPVMFIAVVVCLAGPLVVLTAQ